MLKTLSQVSLTLEERLNGRKETMSRLKRDEALKTLVEVSQKALIRVKHRVFNEIADKASGNIKSQRDIRDMFEMIEQEKAILDEEFN